MERLFNLKMEAKFNLVAILLSLSSLLFGPLDTGAQTKSVKNIVLVHGAFADGSGWKGVYEILTQKGYHVSIVQNPLTSLKDDVKATNSVINRQNGSVILVGHSWGGAIITEAGINPKVTGLVYVAAFMPDKGETAGQWLSSLPGSPDAGTDTPDENGLVFYSKEKFHGGFAADLSKQTSDFMESSQVPILGESFSTPLSAAAWRTKPSYGIVPTQDKSLLPEIARKMYKRGNSKITEVKGSHVIYISQPEAVANVIISAAEQN